MPPPHQLRIAVLFDHIESDYHLEVLSGVLRAARHSRVRTLVVPGGWLSPSTGEPVVRNFIYDLLPSARLDGILVLAGSLSNHCGEERFREWLARFRGIPCFCIGIAVADMPSVHVDNEAGLFAVISHLIEEHRRLRIAFVKGPDASAEAEARLRAYRRALETHGITPEDRLVAPGGFGRENGVAAVQELLDQRRFSPVSLNAIVAGNDDAALGALEELTRRGISVPDPIAVTGFDDTASARSANPPLTTVNQQVELQAYTAARALIETLEKGEEQPLAPLRSEPIIRASCGCVRAFHNDSRSIRPPPGAMARTCRLALIEQRAKILATLARAAAGRLIGMSGWESHLFDALLQELATSDGSFLREVDQLVRRNVGLGRGVMVCHDVLTALRLQALACAALEPASRPRIEDLFQESRLTLSRVGIDVERDHQQALAARMRLVTKACLSLFGKGSIEELARVLEEHLPALGIGAFSITRFRDPEKEAGELQVIARRSLGVWFAPTSVLPASSLALDPVLEQQEMVVLLPLEFGLSPMGIAALAWGAHNPMHYEQLREVLGAAMHGAALSSEARLAPRRAVLP